MTMASSTSGRAPAEVCAHCSRKNGRVGGAIVPFPTVVIYCAPMENRLYTPSELAFAPADFAPREEPREVLLCDPGHFRIEQALNPHMASGGALHKVDPRAAWAQWEALGAAYARLGLA